MHISAGPHAQLPGTRACDAQKHQDPGKHRVRGAPWEEIDREAGEWRILGERMKHQREHRVPMSGRALEILDAAGEGTARTGLVFPSPTGQVLRDLVFNRLLHELEIQAGGPPRSTTNTVASVSASLPGRLNRTEAAVRQRAWRRRAAQLEDDSRVDHGPPVLGRRPRMSGFDNRTRRSTPCSWGN